MKAPLFVSGIIFAAVALLHLARLLFGFPLVIENTLIPLWVNFVGFIIAALLSLWMFVSASRAEKL